MNQALFRTQISSPSGRNEPSRAALARGDAAAWTVLIAQERPELVAYAQSFVEDAAAAEDVVGEVLLWLWGNRRIWAYRNRQAFLRQKVRSAALGWLRSGKRRDRRSTSWAVERHQAPVRSPLDDCEQTMLRHSVEKALAALPKRQQQAVRLVRLNDMTHRQAASTMGITTKTVENLLALAERRLRTSLAAEVEYSCEREGKGRPAGTKRAIVKR